jgi:N-acetylglucosamine malate deacetylase 1
VHILAIHAHPDDWEILAGGTLALLAEAGHRLTCVTTCDGDCGTKVHSREEIGRIRRGEAERAAAMIGAAYEWAGFHDLAIFDDDAGRRRVTALLRRLRPDVVITSAPVDYMPDHEATSALVRDACFAAGAPNYRAAVNDDAPALDYIPALYFMDPIEGVDREGHPVAPHFVVNVGHKFGLKRELLACHDSQRTWLREHHGMDNYLTTMEQWTRHRGQEAGCEFGEGFRQYRGHPYPQTPVLQKLLAPHLAQR